MNANETLESRDQEVKTRYNERRFVTSSPEEMRRLYVAGSLKRWRRALLLDNNVLASDRAADSRMEFNRTEP